MSLPSRARNAITVESIVGIRAGPRRRFTGLNIKRPTGRRFSTRSRRRSAVSSANRYVDRGREHGDIRDRVNRGKIRLDGMCSVVLRRWFSFVCLAKGSRRPRHCGSFAWGRRREKKQSPTRFPVTGHSTARRQSTDSPRARRPLVVKIDPVGPCVQKRAYRVRVAAVLAAKHVCLRIP